MPSSKTSATRSTAAKKSASSKSDPQDALSLLAADHKEVDKLFKAYEKLVKDEADGDERLEISQQICQMLSAHADIEEEIFYPALRGAMEEDDLLDEAEVEHASVKDLVSQIEEMDPDDDLYDAKVKVLGEYVRHHVQEEENEIFPKARKAELDLAQLGTELQARKQELMGETEMDA
ncbi:MAG: hemerythrin domain-containing protein [Pseudomonadota bacterium]